MTIFDKIKSSKNSFKSYIDYIRFPRFRNLEPGIRINFGFPITAFVGQNGCGKSSALQALYGAPKGRSVGNYWFNTELDPIEELQREDRHCLIYSYDGTGNEVLKTRINKKGQLDLWETSEPIQAYGMTLGKRTPPVEKEVIYINFRAIPNAFEKAFHSERPPRSGVQDFLRMRSKKLQQVLRGNARLGNFKEKAMHLEPEQLSAEVLKMAGHILGRTYQNATLVQHRLFGEWGHSIVLHTLTHQYTDAFAGSGESAVLLLVHEVSKAQPQSLLLLDEPETSLHPGAQQKLVEYLADLCLKKKIQIVFCTHSPVLIENLPKEAIKVFTPNSVTGKFRVLENISAREAFFHIGQKVTDKTCIHVEDKLAKLMIDELIEHKFSSWRPLVEVRYQPGGADFMKQDAVLYMRENPARNFLLLDGDQQFSPPPRDPGMFTAAEMQDKSQFAKLLDQEIKNATKLKELKLPIDGNQDGGNPEQKCDQMLTYIRYLRSNVFFLPEKGPEDILWNSSVASDLYKAITTEEWAQIKDPKWIDAQSKKQLFAQLSQNLCHSSRASEIETYHRTFITRWLRGKSTSLSQMTEIIQQIKDRSEQTGS